jgi:hypothetical protein
MARFDINSTFSSILMSDSVKQLPLPWFETPLVESAALSKAAGWYVFSERSIHRSSRLMRNHVQLMVAAGYTLNWRTSNRAAPSSLGESPFHSNSLAQCWSDRAQGCW